ncbi:hypothetical protein Droror1_Dr00025535 [Drosera rotundifolia]
MTKQNSTQENKITYCSPGPTNNCGNEEVPLDDDGCEPGLTGISPIDDDIGSDVADVETYAILPCAGAEGVVKPTSVAGVHTGAGAGKPIEGGVVGTTDTAGVAGKAGTSGGTDTAGVTPIAGVVTGAGADLPIEGGGEVV